MNHASLMGRLTKDPTIRYTQGEKSTCIANFTLAVQDDYDKDKAAFVPCKAFGKTAECVEKYLHKGDYIGVDGRIETGSYEKDGKKVYTTDVVVTTITFTPKVVKTAESGDFSPSQAEEPQDMPAGFEKLGDDDIPF